MENEFDVSEDVSGKSAKLRVLIVEDEIVVALFLEDVLDEFGYQVAGVVTQLDDAMLREPDYDIAVLDVHINGRNVFDFADLLRGATPPSSCHRLWRTGHPRAPSFRSRAAEPSSPTSSNASWPISPLPGVAARRHGNQRRRRSIPAKRGPARP